MENELLLARVEDTLNSSLANNKPKFLGFLSKEEAVLVKKFLDNRNAVYSFYGGEHQANRVYLCCYPEWLDSPIFPISSVTFTFRSVDSLRHRDFLGSLMGLGIKRESVGDILIEQGRAVVFLSDEIVKYVLQNLQKVGRTGVTASLGHTLPLPETAQLKESSATVASTRLDCVVSACANCSRNTANKLINDGLVAINSVVCQKTVRSIENGDIISVRHKGKFEIVSVDKKTKKDRTVLIYKSY